MMILFWIAIALLLMPHRRTQASEKERAAQARYFVLSVEVSGIKQVISPDAMARNANMN